MSLARGRKAKKSEFDTAFITSAQERDLKEDIRTLETMYKNDRSGLYGKPKITDTAEFFAQIKKKEAILENHTPKKFRGKNSNAAYTKAKELAGKIKKVLPDKKDYFRPYPSGKNPVSSDFDFERTVQQQIKFMTDPKIQSMVREYKHIMAKIDPSDPTIRNIERLRD